MRQENSVVTRKIIFIIFYILLFLSPGAAHFSREGKIIEYFIREDFDFLSEEWENSTHSWKQKYVKH